MIARVGVALAAIVSACLVAAPLSGQVVDSLTIPRETYVRVRLKGRPPITLSGRFVGSDSTGLQLGGQWNAPSAVAKWENIRGVDVRVRRSASEAFGRGARVGAIVSGTLAVAAVAAAVTYDVRGDCGECIPPASIIIVPASYLLTIAGTVLGGVVAIPFDYRWQRVWPSDR
jgi:hypothetical protein